MFFWRWIVRTKTLGTGRFYCETCGDDRFYRHYELRRWFCPFFIPMIPSRKSVLVKCNGCSTNWSPSVLDETVVARPRPLPIEWERRLVAKSLHVAGPGGGRRSEVARSLLGDQLGMTYSQFDLDVDVLKASTDSIAELGEVAPMYTLASRERVVAAVAEVLYADGVPERSALEWVTEVGRTAGVSDERLTTILTAAARRA